MRILLPAAVLAALLLAFVPVPAARAEKVDMTPEQLREAATHVVTGEVVRIYERTNREGSWRYVHRVAEVKVAEVEKGAGLEAGGLLYARYWTRSWSGPGPMPPSTSGHRGLPTEGQTLRLYLARNAYHGFGTSSDGGFDVFGANGFEALP